MDGAAARMSVRMAWGMEGERRELGPSGREDVWEEAGVEGWDSEDWRLRILIYRQVGV